MAEHYLATLLPQMTAPAERYAPYFRAMYERAAPTDLAIGSTLVHFGMKLE